jgi:hypothetical protein
MMAFLRKNINGGGGFFLPKNKKSPVKRPEKRKM